MKLFDWLYHKATGKVRCDICGMWVEDVEVPTHHGANNGGGGYVHPFHVIVGKQGRELMKRMSKDFSEKSND